jgi:hypothetical protein
LVRALLTALLIAMPSLALPGVTSDTVQIVALIAIAGAVLVVFEYGSTYPGLVEFRDAPPFNRIRFIALFATVAALTTVSRHEVAPTEIGALLEAVGLVVANMVDFPYSPVRLVVLMLPEGTTLEVIERVRIAAAVAYLISLMSLGVFFYAIRVQNWPVQHGPFNVWVNLPTFDPTSGGDVVERLTRDARLNIALGFLMPFFVPGITKAASSLFGGVKMDDPHTMIWVVAAWAFLPASMFMRGLAMGRIAALIADKRRRAIRTAEALQPA